MVRSIRNAIGFSSGLPWMRSSSFWKSRGRWPRRRAKAVAEPRNELLELLHLQDVRLLMDTIEAGAACAFQVGRDGLVRKQHEFLDQPVSDVAFERNDVFDPALVHDHLGLVQIEIDRSAAPPGIVKDLKQIAHLFEHRHERSVALQQLRIAIGQDAVHRRVRHPVVAVDDPVVKLVAYDAAMTIDFHQGRLDQAVDVGIQAAQPGGQLRGKHVNRTLGEIHRRTAFVRLAIQRAALAHVMRHVGDVNAKPEMTVRQLFERDRVVEIARVLTVDRDGGSRENPSGPECPARTQRCPDARPRSPRPVNACRECRIFE